MKKYSLNTPFFYSKPKKIVINGRIGYYCNLTPRFLKISGRGDNIFLYTENTIHFQAKSVVKQGNRNQFFFIRPRHTIYAEKMFQTGSTNPNL